MRERMATRDHRGPQGITYGHSFAVAWLVTAFQCSFGVDHVRTRERDRVTRWAEAAGRANVPSRGITGGHGGSRMVPHLCDRDQWRAMSACALAARRFPRRVPPCGHAGQFDGGVSAPAASAECAGCVGASARARGAGREPRGARSTGASGHLGSSVVNGEQAVGSVTRTSGHIWPPPSLRECL